MRIRAQLDSTISNWNKHAVVDIRLTGYRFLETPVSAQQLSDVRKQLMDGNNLVPYFDGEHASSFRLSSISERNEESLRTAGEQDGLSLRAQLGQALDTLLRAGQGQVELQWTSQGRRFTTLCVYNEQGLVYDHMLANLFLVEDETESEDANLRKTYTATVRNITIKWIWGSTRGKVIIKHSILVDGGRITSNWGSSEAWMSAGSAAAKKNSYKRYNTYAQLTWAYGWATPTASFKFSYSGKPAKWSVSMSGVGSKGSGSGIHTYYLN
ncbi:hypothetical protein GCM10009415_51220 [Chitinophaga japonensis]